MDGYCSDHALAHHYHDCAVATNLQIIIVSAQPIEQQVSIHLRLDQHQIDEQDDKVMFHVFVGELLAARTLGQAHAFAQRAVIGFAVGTVELRDRV